MKDESVSSFILPPSSLLSRLCFVVSLGGEVISEKLVAGAGIEPAFVTAYETVELPRTLSRKKKIGCGDGSRTHIFSFTRRTL